MCEATRREMKPGDIGRVAELIVCLYGGEDPAKVDDLQIKGESEECLTFDAVWFISNTTHGDV